MSTANSGWTKVATADEAFYSFYSASCGDPTANSGTAECMVGFNASRSNSIYGANTRVQNPALQSLVAIRYA